MRVSDLVYQLSQSMTVGAYLDHLGYPRGSLKELFNRGLVLLNGTKVKANEMGKTGDELRLKVGALKEVHQYEQLAMSVPILYEDEDILVVYKPPYMTMMPSQDEAMPALINGIAYYFYHHRIKSKPRLLNRLDRDTSGCILVPKYGLAQALYQKQLNDHSLEKWYYATVVGKTKDHEVLELPMGLGDDGIHRIIKDDGVMTKTEYERLSYDEESDTSTLRIRLYTGKTHQIRVALAHIGHPLLDDQLYGDHRGGTYQLEAAELVFCHMRTGEMIRVSTQDQPVGNLQE